MRLKNDISSIDYKETHEFFRHRAQKYNSNNPYAVTMYQDKHPELVDSRNKQEIAKLMPLLQLDKDSTLLDVACGIGRWSEAINIDIEKYVGLDFSAELINIAKKRNQKKKHFFIVSSAINIKETIQCSELGNFNRILLIGILMYLNDDDLIRVLQDVESVAMNETQICIREPIGIRNRLTLKDHFSEELEDNYNAIYRTRDEIKFFLEETLLCKGFKISKEGYLFDDPNLNNRRETAQYYFILERK